MKEWEKAWDNLWKSYNYKHEPSSFGVSCKDSFQDGWDDALKAVIRKADDLVQGATYQRVLIENIYEEFDLGPPPEEFP